MVSSYLVPSDSNLEEEANRYSSHFTKEVWKQSMAARRETIQRFKMLSNWPSKEYVSLVNCWAVWFIPAYNSSASIFPAGADQM